MSDVTTPANITIGEAFTHSVPRAWTRYQFAEISFAGFYGPEVVGVMVDGEPHNLCRRCGTGYGHFSWNGEDDICYQCQGEGFGAPKTLDDIARRAEARKRAAVKRESDRLAWIAERDAKIEAFKAAHPDLVAALEAHLPGFHAFEADYDVLGPSQRKPATTFAAKMAVQVFDDLKPLTEGQVAAVTESIAKMAERHAERIEAGHWGTVGKRSEATVTVLATKSFDGDYGTRWLVTMKTTEGHTLKTWTSGDFVTSALDAKDSGEAIKVKATVKDHGLYNGLPETTVSRVALVP